MEMREGAPSLSSRSSPPPEQSMSGIPGLPEATPGPNAFAQQAARLHRHRLEGNAFYQQALEKARANPLTDVHPALRPKTNSDPPSPVFVIPGQYQPRDSTVTTLSPFINAGREPTPPPLRLVPNNDGVAEPTTRGVIEEQREATLHEISGSQEERTPVYTTYAPTPKPTTGEFTSPADTASTFKRPALNLPSRKAVASAALSGEGVAQKSPKKNFFSKFGLTKITGGATASPSPSIPALDGMYGSEGGEHMPVKAQALLGTLPGKVSLGRSPSKQKKGGLFSGRKSVGVEDVMGSGAAQARKSGSEKSEPTTNSANAAEETPQAVFIESQDPSRAHSRMAKTPQTGYSDPTHYTHQDGKRVPSQAFSDHGIYREQQQQQGTDQCPVTRSQSLRYIDSAAPPTPPAKNTPPNQKTNKETPAKAPSNRVPFHDQDSTPSKPVAGVVVTGNRISPTKFGNYAHKDMPRLVTQPSMYSLHASVVPALNEPSTFEEMKARVEGLGLEGFNMPAENYYRRSQDITYSPSIYSVADFGTGGTRASMSGRTPGPSYRKTLDDLPPVLEEKEKTRISQTTQHTPQSKSNSSGCTIPICYPELASDPSVNSGIYLSKDRPSSEIFTIMQDHAAREELPAHGITHSRNHSRSPVRQSLAANIINDPDAGDVIDSDLFAAVAGVEAEGDIEASPASFNHPSAMPSPLQYLPATTYSPPPKRWRENSEGFGRLTRMRANEGDIHIESSPSRPGLTSRGDNVMDTAPSLVADARARYESLSRSTTSETKLDSGIDVDPKKSLPRFEMPADKQDMMLAMLGKILEREHGILVVREEMRAAHARIDDRLATIEQQRTNPVVLQTPNSVVSFGLDGSPPTALESPVQAHAPESDEVDAHTEHNNTDPAPDTRESLMQTDAHEPAEAEAQPEQSYTHNRIATSYAHDFYRTQTTSSESSMNENISARTRVDRETIAELQEANRQLTETVKGFAARLEEMSRRMERHL
ncbi:hypothetical protein D0869_00309 [Hortaea werneckii]|uniref:Uncharacterized protein n=1 Tax=Hortaea werneckii TaxID=91943 RepID=A0A3M6ZYG6_HORWE|nr:hypothetical protein KC355_g9018 [Hortaea werneckii]KAI7205602.1 hypothetical protein KC324_g193 [Hortaea werneckii]KAI7595418.1 hypothetical protein KC316_g566 [Hortaea werneckii]KAI7672508.1 hypothetical protein KC318_g2830 [Hortaea werneckii]RMX90165.1 hypothetical protein D0869_00309 [Hortaea werneckii]